MPQIKEKDWHFVLKRDYIFTVLHTTLKFCHIYYFPLLHKSCAGCQLRVQLNLNFTVS